MRALKSRKISLHQLLSEESTIHCAERCAQVLDHADGVHLENEYQRMPAPPARNELPRVSREDILGYVANCGCSMTASPFTPELEEIAS